MDAKQALEEEPWEAIVENKEAQKYLKSRKCEDDVMEKVKVTTMDELTPLIGKKVIVKDKQIGIFLTENGEVHAINNVCPHKEGPLSEGTVSGEYVYCPLHDQKLI